MAYLSQTTRGYTLIPAVFVDLHSKHEEEIPLYNHSKNGPRLFGDASARSASKINTVTNTVIPKQDFTTSQGPWWFRVATGQRPEQSADESVQDRIPRGPWKILDSAAALDGLWKEIIAKNGSGWVEFQHVFQTALSRMENVDICAGFAKDSKREVDEGGGV
jgi:hypothetical protein